MSRLTFLFLALAIALFTFCAKTPTGAITVPPSQAQQTVDKIAQAIATDDIDFLMSMETDDFIAAYDELAARGDNPSKFYASVLCLAKIADLPTMNEAMAKVRGGEAPALLSKPLVVTPESELAYVHGLQKKTASNDLSSLPEIHAVQDEIEARFFPLFDRALLDLSALANEPSFSFTLTYSDPHGYYQYNSATETYDYISDDIRITKEIDATEAANVLSSFYSLKTYLNYMVAWDFDVDQNGSYAIFERASNDAPLADRQAALNHILSLLTPTSPFLSLRPGKQYLLAQNLELAKKSCDAAILAISNLQGESDPQNDDLIPNNKITNAEFAAVTKIAQTVKQFISGPQTLNLGSQQVSVDLRHFYDVKNIRDLLPCYHLDPNNVITIEMETDYYGTYTTTRENEDAFYLTNSQGSKTATVSEIKDILPADISQWGNYIVWKDPTFNGVLPGMTNSGFWGLMAYLADEGNESAIEGSLRQQFQEVISLVEAAGQSNQTYGGASETMIPKALAKLGDISVTALSQLAR